MSGDIHLVLDETAMVVVGTGNKLASGLVDRAHTDAGWHLYAPAAAVVEADRARPGTAEHLASLPGMTFVDLDLPAALALSRDITWGQAHARHAAAPSPDRPDGAFIVTADPQRWAGEPVRLFDVT